MGSDTEVAEVGDANGTSTRANNLEVVQFSQSQNSFPVHFSQFSQFSQSQVFALRPSQQDALSAAVIEQTVNALPLQPETITDVKGPMLKLKRVDSKSVDVKVIHSFTAHYPTRLTSRRVVEHGEPPALGSQAPERPALMGGPGQQRGTTPARRASPGQTPFAQQQQGDVDMGVECEPVVVEFEEEPVSALARTLPPCGCPGQTVWELDASHIQMGKRIGVGGFSEVFVAKYEGTLVAVKRLLNTGAETARQLCSEVSLLAQLRHPNLLLFMGYTTQPELCIVTEFMARGSLYNILRAQQRSGRLLEPRLQRVVAISVARGMLYLHTRTPTILHLDLKSPNILVDDRWRVKIADFGLSKARARTFVSTSVGSGAGTPEWMPPEMLRCEPLDDRADVYSYGVVLWELLTGEAPWEQLNAMQVVGAVGFAGKRLPLPKEGDPCLLALCAACLSSSPAGRPSFHQIVDTLDAHFAANPLSGAAIGAPSPLGIAPPAPAPLQLQPPPALLPAASAPPSTPSPHPAAAPHGHLQHALTIATPTDRRSPSRQSITPLGRRRERSPDSVDESPPAITTRLANGAKHPSPRLPTPTDPTFLQPITPLPPAASDPSYRTTTPYPTESPRAHLSPAHTHSGHPPTTLPPCRPPSFSSLPTHLPSSATADPTLDPPAAPAPAPYVSPFAQNADAPWGTQSQRDPLPTPDPTQPESQALAPADDPAFVSPFAALAAQITKSLAGHPLDDTADEEEEEDEKLDFDAPAPPAPSPFAAFATAPIPTASQPPSSAAALPAPLHAAAAGTQPADSPVRSWLLTADQPPRAVVAEAAASTTTAAETTDDTTDDPMQADDDDNDADQEGHPHPPHHPHSSPASVGHPEDRTSTGGLPHCPLPPEGQGEAIMADSDADDLLFPLLPTTAAAPAGPFAAHAGSRCASPTPAATSPPAALAPLPPGGTLSPFFTHQLANSSALQEVVQQAPPCLPRTASSAINIPTSPPAKPSELDDSGMPSLDEKTRMLIQCAASSRCYHAGRFRVTSYDLKSEHLSLPNPPATTTTSPTALDPAPTLAPSAFAAASALPPSSQLPPDAGACGRECCMLGDTDNNNPREAANASNPDAEEEGDADVGLQGSCTMYKRGRFFIKSFCHKGRASATKLAGVPKSVMLHTSSSGLVATTSATALHDVTSASSPRSAGSGRGGAVASVNSLRRTVSISYGEIAAGIIPRSARASDDDLYDQRSPAKTPRGGGACGANGHGASQPAAAAPAAAVVMPLLSIPPRGSVSPTASSVGGGSGGAADNDTPRLPARDSLGSQAATPRDAAQPVVECRQYNRGRFNVQENIVVKPQSPPPPAAQQPQPSPRGPAPSPRGPAPSPRGHRASTGGIGVPLKPGSRFTVVEHSASSSSSRPATSKPRASPRATPATSQQDTATAPPAVPKLLGRFKVYEEPTGAPRDPPRPRRSPRPKAAQGCSPHRSPKASDAGSPPAAGALPAAAAAAAAPAAAPAGGCVAAEAGPTALQLVHDALAQSSRRAAAAAAAAAAGMETHSTSDGSGSGGGSGGAVDYHVEVQCDGDVGDGYSIQVDVVMGGQQGAGCAEGEGVGVGEDVMVVDVPADALSVGGGPGHTCSGTDDVTVTVSPVE